MIDTDTFKNVATTPRSAVQKSITRTPLLSKIAVRIIRRVKVQCAIYFAAFYILSALLSSSNQMLLLAIIFPAVCFIQSGFYGIKYGYISHYIAIPVILFIPASFIFFPKFAFLYALCYALTGLIAMTTGALLRQCFYR